MTPQDNGVVEKGRIVMKASAVFRSCGCAKWRALFSARTPLGRSTKILLFGIGAVLPLGSVIWVLLLSRGLHAKRGSSVKPGN
jgi:hypothetical protein